MGSGRHHHPLFYTGSVQAAPTNPLFGLDLEELNTLIATLGEKPYRARQLWDALYKQRAATLDDITTFPATLREKLATAGHTIGLPEITQTAISIDGTERYLVRMADGETVETVWMPDGDGGERGDGSEAADEEAGDNESAEEAVTAKKIDKRNWGALAEKGYRRATICISSQVGCAVNCQFCLTAKLGIKRNLTAGEIAGQVAAVLNRHGVKIGKDRINLVFMGMGEPFLNYAPFMAAVRLLVAGRRHPRVPHDRLHLRHSSPAIRTPSPKSPSAPSSPSRSMPPTTPSASSIMPITRKWNIAAPPRRRVAPSPSGPASGSPSSTSCSAASTTKPSTPREGPRPPQAGMRAKVNLIVWNPGPGIEFLHRTPPPRHRPLPAHPRLPPASPTYIRRPRGRDIYAACGQLKRTVAAETAPPALVAIQAS